jgi:hypothetical protein
MRLTLRTVNNELAKRGIQAEVRKGDAEYFYFWGGDTGEWWDRTVQVPNISSLSLDQWVEAYHDLKRKNAHIMAMGKANAKTAKGGRARTRRSAGR